MTVNADALIREMGLRKYREWAKLFIRYGDPADHEAFFQVLDDHITCHQVKVGEKKADVEHWEFLINNQHRTQLSAPYCRGQLRIAIGHLNGANSKLNKCVKMRDILKGLMS